MKSERVGDTRSDAPRCDTLAALRAYWREYARKCPLAAPVALYILPFLPRAALVALIAEA